MRKTDDPVSPRFITAYGRDVDIEEQELGYDAETRRLTVVGGSRRDSNIEAALPVVLAFIATETTPSRNEIVNGLKSSGYAQQVIKDAIKLGMAQGRITTKPGKRGAQLHSVVTEARGGYADPGM